MKLTQSEKSLFNSDPLFLALTNIDAINAEMESISNAIKSINNAETFASLKIDALNSRLALLENAKDKVNLINKLLNKN